MEPETVSRVSDTFPGKRKLRNAVLTAAVLAACAGAQASEHPYWASSGLPFADAHTWNSRTEAGTEGDDWVWDDARDEHELVEKNFNEHTTIAEPGDLLDESANNLWTVADDVVLSLGNIVTSSTVDRNHFVIRGGKNSVLNSGFITGQGQTIDIAGFDRINIENYVGGTKINNEVSISGTTIVHTLNPVNTGDAIFDSGQGYAFIGLEEHVIHADTYILNRNVSNKWGSHELGSPNAAIYLANSRVQSDVPGMGHGSLEMYARSIQLNNNANDEAALAAIGYGGATFYAQDIQIRGFSEMIEGDGLGVGGGTLAFHADTFLMENDSGFSTSHERYYSSGKIEIEARQHGDLINLSSVSNRLYLTGGSWNIEVNPDSYDDAINAKLTATNVTGEFVVTSDSIYYGTSRDLNTSAEIGFKDGRLLTILDDTLRFGTFDKPISGVVDSNFVIQSEKLEIYGKALDITGEIVLSDVYDEPHGTMYLGKGSMFTGSVRGYYLQDIGEDLLLDPNTDYTPYQMQANFVVGLDSSTWNVTRDAWNSFVYMDGGHLNLAYRPEGEMSTYRTLKTGVLAGYDFQEGDFLRDRGGTLYFNVDLAREAEGALDRIEADNVYGTFIGSVNFDNPQDIDGKLMTESSLIHQGGGSMTVNNPGGKYLAGDGMLSRWTWKFLPESMRDTIDTTNPDALWSLGNTSNDEAGDWVLVRVPSKPWTPIDPPKEPDLPWTDLEPSKPTIPWTPIEPSKPVEPEEPEEPEEPDTSIPWTPIEPSKPVEPSEPEEPEEPDTSVPWTPIGPSTPVTPPEQIDPPSEVEDSFKMGSTIMQAISWWSEKNDLRRRLGEVRYGTQAGAWVKAFHRKDSAGRSTGSSFTQRATGVHVGYDMLVGETGDSRWLVGATFRYANSDQDGDGGLGDASGRMDEYSLKGYFVWMNDAGWYADSLVQAGWYEHEMEGVPNSGRGRFKADYNVWGMGTSLEVGRKIEFGTNHTGKLGWMNGMFVEPQVELSFFHTAGTDYTLSTGMHVDQDKADFLTGRAGLVIGKKFDYSADPSDRRYVQVALSGGFTREFLGENTMFYRGTDGEVLHQNEKLDELRHYYGMVWDWQFRQDMRFYGEVEREVGDYYRKDYSVTFGLKYSFN